MKSMNSMKRLSLAVLMATGMVGSAWAAVDESSIVSKSVEVTFAEPAIATISLHPKSGLVAGDVADKTVLADGEVSVNAGKAAMRWAPTATGQSVNPHDSKKVTLTKGENILKASIDAEVLDTGSEGWLTSQGAGEAGKKIDYTIKTDGQQSVNADTWTLTMDAAVWND